MTPCSVEIPSSETCASVGGVWPSQIIPRIVTGESELGFGGSGIGNGPAGGCQQEGYRGVGKPATEWGLFHEWGGAEWGLWDFFFGINTEIKIVTNEREKLFGVKQHLSAQGREGMRLLRRGAWMMGLNYSMILWMGGRCRAGDRSWKMGDRGGRGPRRCGGGRFFWRDGLFVVRGDEAALRAGRVGADGASPSSGFSRGAVAPPRGRRVFLEGRVFLSSGR